MKAMMIPKTRSMNQNHAPKDTRVISLYGLLMSSKKKIEDVEKEMSSISLKEIKSLIIPQE
jgi:hypothetical protein